MSSFGWLHLTDLHMGMAQQPGLLPTIKNLFLDRLEALYEASQPWDLVVFTGDLTQYGDPEQFNKLDDFLNDLWNTLQRFGAKASLVAVPGNHDLVRLRNLNYPTRLLTTRWETDAELRNEFWSNPESDLRKTITAAFQNYVEWWERTQFKPPIVKGLLPGDFSAVCAKDGASLGIVGLNSTFLQLISETQKGSMAIDPRQFQGVCDGDGPAWVRKHNACLLLTHHPPDWFNQESQEYLTADIVGNDNFAAHLFGHMHEARYEYHSIGGAPEVRVFQGTSLFGLEQFGDDENKVDRRHGYSAGRIDLRGEEGILTFWPMTANRVGGQWNFVVDTWKIFIEQGHTRPKNFPLKKPFVIPSVSASGNDNQPVMTETVFKKRWAVLVGINGYEHFAKLEYCRQDVIDLAQKLSDDLSFDEVLAIYEQQNMRPDRDSIFVSLNKLRSANKIGSDDLLLFYFAGHGINEGGKDYLLPIGAHPSLIKKLGISVQELIEELKKFDCKHTVMFIDACRETVAGARGIGAASDNSKAIGAETDALVKKANIVTFFSCSPDDRSYEIKDLQHGSFTYCILEAIKEGTVTTVKDLDRYLVLNVPDTNRKHDKPVQLPYTVTIPETSRTWAIFFRVSPLTGKYGTYAALAERLKQLAANDKTFAEDTLPSTLEFLDRISDNLELKSKEQMKLNAIKALCADELTLEEFSDTWQVVHRKQPASPESKRPKGLSNKGSLK
jgi:uncharacterized caspase-like protein